MIKREFLKKIHDFVMLHRGLTCAAIILFAIFLAVLMMVFRPKAKRKPQPKMKVMVNVREVKPENYRVQLFAMGQVKAKREIKLFPQISGKVSKISEAYDEGSLVKEGDVLLEIEQADYRSRFDLAKAAYEKEEGRQGVAKQEYAFLKEQVSEGNTPDAYLALRGPELKTAKANLDIAALNLERTVIRAPYDAIVLNKSVDLGQYITPQTLIAELKSSDVFRIEALLPVSKLKWLEGYASDTAIGNTFVLQVNNGETVMNREGSVIRVLDTLKSKSHMGRVLIEVKNPLVPSEKNPNPLFLESFVDVVIDGREINNVYRISRSSLRAGDMIWFEDRMKLGIKQVDVVYRDKRYVYFFDKSPSIKLITNDIATPVGGIELKIIGDENESK